MDFIKVIVSYRWVRVEPSALKPKGEPNFVAGSLFQYWVVKASDASHTPMSKLASQDTIAYMVLSHARQHGVPAMSVRRIDAKPAKRETVSEKQLGLFGDGDE